MPTPVRISDDTYARLKDYAEKENRSISNAVDHLLMKYLIEYPDIGKVGNYVGPPKFVKDNVKASVDRGITVSPGIPMRDKGHVLADIREWEDSQKDNIDPTIVQDPETLAKNRKLFEDTKQALWAEYHQLKGE